MTENREPLPARIGALVLDALRECRAGEDDVLVWLSGATLSIMSSSGQAEPRTIHLGPDDLMIKGLDPCD